MSNPSNHGNFAGRLASDPVIFTNPDGSRSVRITVIARRNYLNTVDGERKRLSDAIDFEEYIPATSESNGIYNIIHTGDLVSLSYALKRDVFKRKDGSMAYETKLVVDEIQPLESKAVTTARHAQRVAEANEAPAADEAPVDELV